MINPDVVNELYRATVLHFTSSYDIFDYKARCKTKDHRGSRIEHLINRIANRFSKKSDVINYVLASCIYQGNIFDKSEADLNYDKWIKFKIASTQIIIDEFHDKDIDELIEGDSPLIFQHINRGDIGIESAAALNKLTNWCNKNYFLYEKQCVIINKLRRFIKFDDHRVRVELELHKYNCYKRQDTQITNSSNLGEMPL